MGARATQGMAQPRTEIEGLQMSSTVGVVGCGRWGSVHLNNLLEMKRIGLIGRVVACDLTEKTTQSFLNSDARYRTWQARVSVLQLPTTGLHGVRRQRRCGSNRGGGQTKRQRERGRRARGRRSRRRSGAGVAGSGGAARATSATRKRDGATRWGRGDDGRGGRGPKQRGNAREEREDGVLPDDAGQASPSQEARLGRAA